MKIKSKILEIQFLALSLKLDTVKAKDVLSKIKIVVKNE